MAAFNVVMTAPRLAAPAQALLEQAGCQVHFMPPYPSAEAVAALTGEVQADAIISRQGPVEAIAMDASPRLRIVARHGVGVDDVDLAAAGARGILVTRAPGSNARAVAEHTLALILALVKDLKPLSASIAAGGWRGTAGAVRDVAGLRLGLVGYGAIGQGVARLAEAFGMVVAHHTRSSGVSLAALLPVSDVLSLHCPLTPDTHHLIGAAALAALPAGAFVINTSRGGLIDETALLAALGSGHIAGAGLDVLEGEPPPAGYPLRAHPRVIVTPHVAGVTPESLVMMGVMAAECIVAALTGAPVPPERVVPC
jgi:D-3-phosphoglycerate dehydrogenase / 2-oxoglutarate reductase